MFSLLPQARAGVIDQRVEDVSQVAIWSTSAFFFLAIFRQNSIIQFLSKNTRITLITIARKLLITVVYWLGARFRSHSVAGGARY
jgi:hypothetical protein